MNHSAGNKSRMRSVASNDNYRSKCTALWMLSFIFAARYKPVEGTVRWSRHGVSVYRMPSWLRGPTRPRSQRDSQTRPHRRAVSTKPRSGHVPLSRRHPRFIVVRANLCALRETCMAPESPPTACNRVGPNLANLTDVPVRFDRRSIIVKSSLPLLASCWIYSVASCGCVQVVDDDRPTDRIVDRRENCKEGSALFSLACETDNKILFFNEYMYFNRLYQNFNF